MKIPQHITQALRDAEHKALATYGKKGINVVPVSTMFVEKETILLVDYFFKKTAENLKENHTVALACWSGLEGYQIKGTCKYLNQGKVVSKIKKWAAQKHPDRTVSGVLSITPEDIYTVGANSESGYSIFTASADQTGKAS